ncbi:mechanosensitive ion channel family protein [Rhizobium sp. BK376]|uniref:mechanosensitive ion channel family protein n=1 Tax=Rhizobium sp. BK376 TaxID=2512149 RepID=UPI001049CFF0|nr:mechanosensitive ion channel family protein [Rhizobium sp. BK376]TCR87936.1 small conductance mechanosensitive channel [Rhizobium sp. BK376]
MRPIGKLDCGRKLFLFLALLLGMAGSVAAQSDNANVATQQKVDQLIKLLDDPDIRTLLATQTKEQAKQQPEALPKMAMQGMSASDLTVWLNSVQAHLLNVRQAIPLVPGELARIDQKTMASLNGRSPGSLLLLFFGLVAIGLIAEWAFSHVARHIRARRANAQTEASVTDRFYAIGRHVFIELAPLVIFGVATVGLFLTMSWPPLLSQLIVPTLLGLIAGRLVIRLSRVILAPFRAASGETFIRLVPIEDKAARFWFWRVVRFTLIFFIGWASDGIMRGLTFQPTVAAVVGYAIGILLWAVTVETVWNRPRSVEQPTRRTAKDWMLIFWLSVIWLLWVADLKFAMWLAAYVILIPAALPLASSIIRTACRREEMATSSDSAVYEVLVERGVRAAIIGLAVLWLAAVLQTHSAEMMQQAAASRITRGILSGIAILLAADILWQVVKALITHQLERARLGEGSAADAARSSRLLTLLPILRNFLAVLIAAIAIMMALSGLGVEVGPLIAGAGIFGVAIGFGSQTLVKDVISGIFYMLDDAFRVGEYIQSGNYKGTVESFSIRSVKLRHHRGPIFTVPFGSLGAVENMSRDWVIDKFLISVSYKTDIALVRKLVKGVGAALLEDPELGPMIIETVKMKGVEQFGDYGINLSFAMTTKPGEQSTIRRRAFAMIREVFDANNIEFASPTVQVANDERVAALAAAAATNNAIVQKRILNEEAGGEAAS